MHSFRTPLPLRILRAVAAAAVVVATFGGCDGSSGAPRRTVTPTTTATPSPTTTVTHTTSPTGTPTATATATATPTADPERAWLGGDTTVFNVSRNAFAMPAENLDGERLSDFFVGNSFFNRNWVSAPSSTTGLDGLGPLFNARSCSACHFKDGRGAPPESPDESPLGLLFRMGVGNDPNDPNSAPHPVYGDQLQPRGNPGVPGEGDVRVTYIEIPGTYVDGSPYSLRQPVYTFVDLSYGPLDPAVQVSPRVAPAVHGLGLLEAIPEETILDLAEMQALAGEVSGRPNYVHDARTGGVTLGRFGWKANQPSLEQQNAGAFLGDIGMTTPLFSEQNCTSSQPECAAAPNGGTPEIDRSKLDFVTFYTHLLAVPARRDLADPEVELGEHLFRAIGCASCHIPQLKTGVLEGFPELSEQTIRPYTDLLLHDMGPDLADGRPDLLANGREWRTPPLWGIGLLDTVNRHTYLLHDGRARGFAEAILWHGGEAEAARERFRRLSEAERAALLRFLESL